MWTILTGKRKSKVDETIYEYEYLQREDGLTLTLVGGGREGQQTFRMKGSFGELQFLALRYNPDNQKPLKHYIVYLKLMGRDSPNEKVLNESLIREHALDIESALLNFPNFTDPDNKPPKRVLFNISEPAEVHRYVTAKEL